MRKMFLLTAAWLVVSCLAPACAPTDDVELVWRLEREDGRHVATVNGFAQTSRQFPVEWLPVQKMYSDMTPERRGTLRMDASLLPVSADGSLRADTSQYYAAKRLSSDQSMFLFLPAVTGRQRLWLDDESPLPPEESGLPFITLEIGGVSVDWYGMWHLSPDKTKAILSGNHGTIFYDVEGRTVIRQEDLVNIVEAVAAGGDRVLAGQRQGKASWRLAVLTWAGEVVWASEWNDRVLGKPYIFPDGRFLYYTTNEEGTICVDVTRDSKALLTHVAAPPKDYAAGGTHMLSYAATAGYLWYYRIPEPDKPERLGEYRWEDTYVTGGAVSADGRYFAVTLQNNAPGASPRFAVAVFDERVRLIETIPSTANPPLRFWGGYLCVGVAPRLGPPAWSFHSSDVVEIYAVGD